MQEAAEWWEGADTLSDVLCLRHNHKFRIIPVPFKVRFAHFLVFLYSRLHFCPHSKWSTCVLACTSRAQLQRVLKARKNPMWSHIVCLKGADENV